MHLNELLDTFSRNNGIERPVQNKDKKYPVPVEGLELFCFEQDRRLYLQAHLGPLSQSKAQRQDETRRLLEHSMGLIKEQRVSLTVDRDAGVYVLWQRLPLEDLDIATFQETVERFGGCGLSCQSLLGSETAPRVGGQFFSP